MVKEGQAEDEALHGGARKLVEEHDEGHALLASAILNSRGFDRDVVEAALAHQDRNAIRRTYNRSTYWDQHVTLMQD